jgi:hypothetical protein
MSIYLRYLKEKLNALYIKIKFTSCILSFKIWGCMILIAYGLSVNNSFEK